MEDRFNALHGDVVCGEAHGFNAAWSARLTNLDRDSSFANAALLSASKSSGAMLAESLTVFDPVAGRPRLIGAWLLMTKREIEVLFPT